MTVIVLVCVLALLGFGALAGTIACVSSQRSISRRIESGREEVSDAF